MRKPNAATTVEIRPPCPRCVALIGRLDAEKVQPLPVGALAPLGLDGQRCCHDCAVADALLRLGMLGRLSPRDPEAFLMARIAVGNDRLEQLRLPGAPMGLVQAGLMRPSKPGDLERHHIWLDAHEWFGETEE